ncbi:hypothetical protein AVEN_65192-1 [Araneus ventricosus]|uniref:Endonuclease/exonuclease/phosphatase domain-containing protein n=1 Tax=Araneus ventricosus TaxID=182803 RepID=A0A4Y2AFU7_ARAVE|nr:hypothetical protein AVEN_65192-1 [Araneus ventricosus]
MAVLRRNQISNLVPSGPEAEPLPAGHLGIDEEFHIVKDVPIIVMGDLNVDVKRNEEAFGFMKKHFDLNVVPKNYPSTLGNSYIDLTFTRSISPELLNYVCYHARLKNSKQKN